MIRAFTVLRGFRRSPTTAEEWAARAQSADLSRHEQMVFDAWLKANPRNAEEYARCNKLGHLAAQLRAHPDLVNAMPAYAMLAQASHRSPHRPVLWAGGLAVAAAMVAMVIAPPSQIRLRESNTFVTAHGEQRQVPLADGSRVNINTSSELTVAFTNNERRVELKRGEAFFDVTRDPGRPFIVRAGDSEIRVVGTKFSVRRDAGSTEVVVTEGKVNVVTDAIHHSPLLPEKIDLLPGNALRLDHASDQVKLASIDPERATSWRSGNIEFDASTLEDVIAEVNRYTAKQFVIEGERLKTIRLSGHFKIGDASSVKFALQEGFQIQAVEHDDEILLRPGP
jgi:transmembrane sensor